MLLDLKINKQTRSEASKIKVIIKRASNISINEINLSKLSIKKVYKNFKKAHHKEVTQF